jgi:protein O-mannosyl-transferase
MKSKKREIRKGAAPIAAAKPQAPRWPYALAAMAAVIAGFWVYSPALYGPFLFDDTTLPFALPGFSEPLRVWLTSVRPVLYFTYWLNVQLSGDSTFSYHVINVLMHCLTSGLIFLIVRRLLEWVNADCGRRDLVAGFCAALFLLHPIQTEAVAYLAGRSESLSVMFALTAFTVFIYRKDPAARWTTVAAVLLLFGAALLSKEHTIALPALLLLTDYWWNPGFSLRGIRANWRLYAPIALGALAGVALFWRLITSAETAGFGMKDFTWYQYFFTQCRALFVYISAFLLPVRLRVDWDFPISKTIFDRGAIFGLIALLALCAAAWYYRRRFPLAAYGFFAYLILMAPTSSILPIRDPIAERRLYFSMLGLLLIVADGLTRIRLERKSLFAVCAVVLAAAAASVHARARIWSDAVLLWEDAARKSPNKPRVRFQLAFAYYEQGRFQESVAEFENAAKLESPTHNMLIDWGLAYDALNQPALALAKLRQAAQIEATGHVYSQIGMVYAKRSQWSDALDALATAEKVDPRFAPTYLYRGKIYIATNMPALAVANLERALALDPSLVEARQELLRAQRMLRAGR